MCVAHAGILLEVLQTVTPPTPVARDVLLLATEAHNLAAGLPQVRRALLDKIQHFIYCVCQSTVEPGIYTPIYSGADKAIEYLVLLCGATVLADYRDRDVDADAPATSSELFDVCATVAPALGANILEALEAREVGT